MYTVGLDIGGANLKAADGSGRAASRSFRIWEAPERLQSELVALLEPFSGTDVIAVTVTAELADCFRTKAHGVDFILRAVEEVAGTTPVYVWQTGAEFVSPDVAREIPLLVAASNWHALATWVGRLVPESGALLIDIGSTTTDIIPLLDGIPVPTGLTDCERLRSGELVYSGVRRTPLCAIARVVPFRDGDCPLASELFATTLDVHLTLGAIADDANDCDTANGRPATRAEAHDRLARMLCCDSSEFTAEDAQSMAHFLADVQKQRIAGAVRQVLAQPEAQEIRTVLLSGTGEFLAQRICTEHRHLTNAGRVSLSCTFNASSSESACAVAIARLASERLAGMV